MTPRKLLRSKNEMSVGYGRQYPGGYNDPDVEAMAYEDGQAAVHNPSIWGENTHPHAADVLCAGHDSNAGLIAHQYRDTAQQVAAELEAEVLQAKSAEQRALDASENKRGVQVSLLRLRYKIEAAGLSVPSPRSLVVLIVGLGALFLGETALIATSYMVFGLSDAPLIPGVRLSNELYAAAYASVTALVVMAHVAGHKLRLIDHDFEQRRLATTDEAKSKLPRIAWFSLAMIGICLLVAWLLLDGLSMIRADYLRADGKNVQSLPFLAVQLGIFAAAMFLGYLHTHPYGRDWGDQRRELAGAEKGRKRAEKGFNARVGSVNGKIDLLKTLQAEAGHHVGVSASDVRRQISLYARRAILSQPEPTRERLFAHELPRPTAYCGEELSQFLIGVAPVPAFEKLSTDALTKRQEEIRMELRELDETLRALRFSGEVAKELPEFDRERR